MWTWWSARSSEACRSIGAARTHRLVGVWRGSRRGRRDDLLRDGRGDRCRGARPAPGALRRPRRSLRPVRGGRPRHLHRRPCSRGRRTSEPNGSERTAPESRAGRPSTTTPLAITHCSSTIPARSSSSCCTATRTGPGSIARTGPSGRVLVGEHDGLYPGAQAEFQKDTVEGVSRSDSFRRIAR